jgi:NDP-sugar pyrophosphorylase family protein
MRELTNELPKPMLPVHGKPILEHIIQGIAAAGVKEIFIVIGFKAEVIENYFGDGAKWNLHIAYGRQAVQDGTGKAPELGRDFVGASPFFLTYGDILVEPDTYRQMLHRYNEDYFSGVITVIGSEDVTKGGLVFFDEQFRFKRLVEKPGPEQLEELRRDGWLKPGDTAWYNAGIYIFRPSLFEFTAKLQKSPRGEYELTDAISALAASRHVIAGMKIPGRWVDVRDPEVLAKLEAEARPKDRMPDQPQWVKSPWAAKELDGKTVVFRFFGEREGKPFQAKGNGIFRAIENNSRLVRIEIIVNQPGKTEFARNETTFFCPQEIIKFIEKHKEAASFDFSLFDPSTQ